MLRVLLKLVPNVKIYSDHDFETKYSFVENRHHLDQFYSLAMFPFEKHSRIVSFCCEGIEVL